MTASSFCHTGLECRPCRTNTSTGPSGTRATTKRRPAGGAPQQRRGAPRTPRLAAAAEGAARANARPNGPTPGRAPPPHGALGRTRLELRQAQPARRRKSPSRRAAPPGLPLTELGAIAGRRQRSAACGEWRTAGLLRRARRGARGGAALGRREARRLRAHRNAGACVRSGRVGSVWFGSSQ